MGGLLADVLVLRRHFLVAGELRVVELEGHLGADARLELAGAEPLRPLVRLADVGPDALDGAGQQALELHGAGLDHGDGTVHLLLLFFGDGDGLRAFSIASSVRSAASRLSRRELQNARVLCIQRVSSSKGPGSSDRKWSRPETRRRTRPARSRSRMCLETELSEMPNG